MQFHIQDINRYISSFLTKDDIISFVKTSKNLKYDLCDLPYKKFIFDSSAGMNEIKLLMTYSNDIEELHIIECDFADHILCDYKNLKTLRLIRCKYDEKSLDKYEGVDVIKE